MKLISVEAEVSRYLIYGIPQYLTHGIPQSVVLNKLWRMWSQTVDRYGDMPAAIESEVVGYIKQAAWLIKAGEDIEQKEE